MARTPDQILDDLDGFALTSQGATDIRSLVWELIEDMLDSVRLACADLPNADAINVVHTVTDYVTNHYGDD